MNLLDRLDFGWGARLPMSLQTEAAECGLACLAMIAGYHGYASDLTELRRRLAVSLKGVNLKTLVGMADRLGFASRPVRLELDELRMLKTPCILHWDLNHFVVLKRASGDNNAIESLTFASSCSSIPRDGSSVPLNCNSSRLGVSPFRWT